MARSDEKTLTRLTGETESKREETPVPFGHRNLRTGDRTGGLPPAVDNRATRPNKDIISAIDGNVVTDSPGNMATIYRAQRRGEPRIHRHRRDCQSSPW